MSAIQRRTSLSPFQVTFCPLFHCGSCDTPCSSKCPCTSVHRVSLSHMFNSGLRLGGLSVLIKQRWIALVLELVLLDTVGIPFVLQSWENYSKWRHECRQKRSFFQTLDNNEAVETSSLIKLYLNKAQKNLAQKNTEEFLVFVRSSTLLKVHQAACFLLSISGTGPLAMLTSRPRCTRECSFRWTRMGKKFTRFSWTSPP